ncbi:MAG: hypothetical protein Q9218_004142 [Villophora microphyllina]
MTRPDEKPQKSVLFKKGQVVFGLVWCNTLCSLNRAKEEWAAEDKEKNGRTKMETKTMILIHSERFFSPDKLGCGHKIFDRLIFPCPAHLCEEHHECCAGRTEVVRITPLQEPPTCFHCAEEELDEVQERQSRAHLSYLENRDGLQSYFAIQYGEMTDEDMTLFAERMGKIADTEWDECQDRFYAREALGQGHGRLQRCWNEGEEWRLHEYRVQGHITKCVGAYLRACQYDSSDDEADADFTDECSDDDEGSFEDEDHTVFGTVYEPRRITRQPLQQSPGLVGGGNGLLGTGLTIPTAANPGHEDDDVTEAEGSGEYYRTYARAQSARMAADRDNQRRVLDLQMMRESAEVNRHVRIDFAVRYERYLRRQQADEMLDSLEDGFMDTIFVEPAQPAANESTIEASTQQDLSSCPTSEDSTTIAIPEATVDPGPMTADEILRDKIRGATQRYPWRLAARERREAL